VKELTITLYGDEGRQLREAYDARAILVITRIEYANNKFMFTLRPIRSSVQEGKQMTYEELQRAYDRQVPPEPPERPTTEPCPYCGQLRCCCADIEEREEARW
jgi:hypothetical protein